MATDNFNRSNGALGANWDGAGGSGSGCVIVSNQVHASDINLNVNFWVGAGSFDDDQFAEVTIVDTESTSDDGRGAGPSVRGDGSSEYNLLFAGQWVTLMRRTTYLDDHSETVAPGDIARLEVTGTALSGLLNDVEQISATDATLTTGAPGLVCRPSAATTDTIIDDWEGDSLGAGGDTNAILISGDLLHPIIAGRLVL